VNRNFNFSYFESDYLTSGLTVPFLARAHCSHGVRVYRDIPCCSVQVQTVKSLFRYEYIRFFICILAVQLTVGPWPLFQFLSPIHRGRTPWIGDQPVAGSTYTQNNTNTIQTSMHWVAFEPTIPSFERAKTVHVLDRAAAVQAANFMSTNFFCSTTIWNVATPLQTFYTTFLILYCYTCDCFITWTISVMYPYF
jgi:hypothetical protein